MRVSVHKLRRLIREAIEDDEKSELLSIYSDVYKEKYGVRPGHLRWMELSVEQLQNMLDDLYEVPAEEMPDFDDTEDRLPAAYADFESGSHDSDDGDFGEPDAVTHVPLKGGDEYDALTRAKRYHTFRPGQRKAAKRSYNRRLRRAFRDKS